MKTVSRRRSAAALLLLIPSLAGSTVAAQTGAVPAPDTLGANFDPSEPGTAGPDAFDFLIGEWNFRFQSRRGDGSYNAPRLGHWKVWKSHGGLVVEDEWRLEPNDGDSNRVTLTYRAWNPERKLWEMTGVVPGEGSFEPGLAWGTGDERRLVQHYGDYMTRIRYYAITPNHFLWRSDGSGDGGKTWQRDLWKMEATRSR
jgi:hypothetical protein